MIKTYVERPSEVEAMMIAQFLNPRVLQAFVGDEFELIFDVDEEIDTLKSVTLRGPLWTKELFLSDYVVRDEQERIFCYDAESFHKNFMEKK